MIMQASSLVGTTVVTSGLGYAFWSIAARLFPTSIVGYSAAVISAMTLLGSVATLGLSSLLIREFPRRPGQEQTLLVAGMAVTFLFGFILGMAFSFGAPFLARDLAGLSSRLDMTLIFSAGVGLTAAMTVLDQALIGLSRGRTQLFRNTLFAVLKLVLLIGAAMVAVNEADILYSWVAGIVLSWVLFLASWSRIRIHASGLKESAQTLWSLSRAAARHHALNLALAAPGLALPVLVTTVLGATSNAYFYTAWMIAGFVFIGPLALATALYAAGSRDPNKMGEKMRLSLLVASGVGLLANILLLPSADLVMSLFGAEYAEQGANCLRILGLGTFPYIIKDHFVAVSRTWDNVGVAAATLWTGCIVELGAAAFGASVGGLFGLAMGWLISATLVSLVLWPTVQKGLKGWKAEAAH